MTSRWIAPIAVAALAVAAGLGFAFASRPTPSSTPTPSPFEAQGEKKPDAPELDGGVAWLNSAGPVKLKDLRGKVVLLDFWTLCCINCIHVMPDLAKLEKKYPNELVVIGVHSAKFENEKDTKSIRKAVLRYELAHPVVNDADHKIWDAYNVSSWPSFALIDPEGKYLGAASGEGNLEILDRVIGKVIAEAKKKGTLNEKPVRFDLVRYRETGDTPLFFPGKILADEKSNRLFIADSTHHRLVVTDLAGKKLDVIGSGNPGFKDGDYSAAQFDDPQGMALDGETLYLADRKNHSIRLIDLKAKTVGTVVGNGQQSTDYGHRSLDKPVPAKGFPLNSPWDVLLLNGKLYIAMAGHHQIWTYDLATKTVMPFSGSGRENIKDGPHFAANFAQPSGLTTDGTHLYVADSEVSAVRKVPLTNEGRVTTLIGEGLFEFGDVDGTYPKARLQHALGVVNVNGTLYIADTYNSKIKALDPAAKQLTSFVGGDEPAGWFGGSVFNEPAGISYAAGKLYVADTNAHRIRTVDLKTKQVETLTISGLAPPPPQKDWQPK